MKYIVSFTVLFICCFNCYGQTVGPSKTNFDSLMKVLERSGQGSMVFGSTKGIEIVGTNGKGTNTATAEYGMSNEGVKFTDMWLDTKPRISDTLPTVFRKGRGVIIKDTVIYSNGKWIKYLNVDVDTAMYELIHTKKRKN